MKKKSKISAKNRFKICAKFKLKKNSGAKKRVRFTSSGLVLTGFKGKRHGMINKSKRFIRTRRGLSVRCADASKVIKKFFVV